jgi:hypothetical protein
MLIRTAALALVLFPVAAAAAAQEPFEIQLDDALRWERIGAEPAGADGTTISIDTAFPPRLCTGLSSGPACAAAWHEPFHVAGWQGLPAGLSPPIVADPHEPDVLYGGDVLRYDRRTAQIVDVRPDGVPGAGSGAVPKTFTSDGRTLLVGTTAVYRTATGGNDWTRISPDWATLGARVAAVSVSPVDARRYWVGLSNGAVRLTINGGETWHDRTPPAGTAAAQIRSLDGSHFDPESAYAVVRVNGSSRLFRTRDSGVTWLDLTSVMPPRTEVFALREDRFRRGLLFAGTNQSVLVSFDDGGSWRPMNLDLPAGSITALAIADSDLIAAGPSGIWRLRDFSPLRQLTADVTKAPFFLFRPPNAHRARATAAPPEAKEPDVPTPGATLTYFVDRTSASSVSLEIIETRTGELIRRWSSEPGTVADGRPVDGEPLKVGQGLHRIVWDLRYSPPVDGDDVPGTRVLPGTYQVRLIVDGRMMRQAIAVRMDPRVRTSLVDLTALRDLGRVLDGARAAVAARRAEAGPTDSARSVQLDELAAELRNLARVLEQADVRPTARVEAAIETAIQKVAGSV